jgi:hypothetical protein
MIDKLLFNLFEMILHYIVGLDGKLSTRHDLSKKKILQNT